MLEGGLRSYKDQLAFGAHVLVMMGTFYAVGHVAGGAVRPVPAYVRLRQTFPRMPEVRLYVLRRKCATLTGAKTSRL